LTYLFAITGLLLLFLGGDVYVRSLVNLSESLNISKKISGIVIGGVGTSMPELVVCYLAAREGHVGLVVGNVLGSNIANVMLILGIAGLMSTVTFSRKLLWFDAKYMVMVALLLMLFSIQGILVFWMGLVFVLILIFYYGVIYRQESRVPTAVEYEHPTTKHQLISGVVLFFVGLGLLILGSDLFVNYSVIIARQWGLSETVIGLTLVAIGTSLPEVSTCVMAALKNQADIVMGNLIGSNIFNILGVLGIILLGYPMPISHRELLIDGSLMFLTTLFFAALIYFNRRINKRLAGVMLLLYFSYIFVLAPLMH
jgi:cation:H+ antiporter